MLKISSSVLSTINPLTYSGQYLYTKKPRKILNLHQRLKKYGKMPQKYKLKTLIRPPNLRDPSIQYPIRIPIRYRHLYEPTKPLFMDSSKQIKWQRLTPNEILLAFENIKYLTHKQLIVGLEYISKIQGQENHDWNQHPWVNQSFEYLNKNFLMIQPKQLMFYYHLLKKLNCKHQEFWKKLYYQIEEHIYDLYPSEFENIFLTYYKNTQPAFSVDMKAKLLKLMEGRLRQFKNSSILKIFQIYVEQDRIDNYWLQNVFIPLFKNSVRKYKIEQVGQIFRFMMIVNHEKNQRLYDSLYKRILTHQYKNIQQVELIQDVIMEVKEIFTSHRVDPYLQFLEKEKERLGNVKDQKKLELHQIVKQDLIFFMEKQKIKQSKLV